MSRLARAVAVALATATAVLPVGPLGAPSATAATCAAGGGVSVVVDFNSLGGGVQTTCVADGGGDKAPALFAAAGHTLARVQQQPGFVCRVDDLPSPQQEACVKTPPEDAYWGLWWSNGTSGSWTYSTVGVDGLTIPDGGSVALSWDDVDGSAPPGASPPKAASSPSPSSAPATSPAASPTKKTTSTAGGSTSESSSAADGTAGATAEPTATSSTTAGSAKERKRARKGRDSDEAPASATASDSATPEVESSTEASAQRRTTEAAGAEPDGLPVWVAPVALLVLAAGGGGAVWLRRRSIP